jgi:Helix-turn-helix domain/Arabinose-binding domain of AraC transcription regulator, N-term
MSLGGAFRVVLAELASVGLDPAAVCCGAQVDPRALHDDAVLLGVNELTRVLEQADALSGDGLLGLHMAERAQGRGVLFSEVVEGVRRTLAEGLVREGRDLTEVAQRVGYADPAAFGKAFRRWFGESPSVFRARRRPPV